MKFIIFSFTVFVGCLSLAAGKRVCVDAYTVPGQIAETLRSVLKSAPMPINALGQYAVSSVSCGATGCSLNNPSALPVLVNSADAQILVSILKQAGATADKSGNFQISNLQCSVEIPGDLTATCGFETSIQ